MFAVNIYAKYIHVFIKGCVAYWNWYKICHIQFTPHAYKQSFVSEGDGGSGVGVFCVCEWKTTGYFWYKENNFQLRLRQKSIFDEGTRAARGEKNAIFSKP